MVDLRKVVGISNKLFGYKYMCPTGVGLALDRQMYYTITIIVRRLYEYPPTGYPSDSAEVRDFIITLEPRY